MQHSLIYPTERQRRIRRRPLDFAIIFLVLTGISLAMSLVVWQFWHANRIFTGVRIASTPVGGMTRLEAMNLLNREIQSFPLPPVSLTYGGEIQPLVATSLHAGQVPNGVATIDLASAVNRAYLSGREGPLLGKLREQLLALLVGINVQPQVTFDRAQFRQMISQATAELRRPARPERVVEGVVIPAQHGINVDVEATLQLTLETLRREHASNQPIVIPVVVQEVSPSPAVPEPEAVMEPVGAATLPSSLVLKSTDGSSFAIDPATMNTLLYAQDPPLLDKVKLTALLEAWAERIDFKPRDARLQFNPATGTINILQTSQMGRELNVEATVGAVERAIAAGEVEAAMVIDTVVPAVDMNQIPEMGIRELVASGTSYFAGSSAARIRNIEVAAEKFEGVVIPPGELFSFNQLVEDVSSANGFEDSLIIWGDQTAVGVGGGVCQVSTTVFRAAYEAGLPIVERYNHGYVVSWYGEPGLDATIYTPTVDFKFRNDTGAFLLIDPTVDSANGVITFHLYGTKPDRQVIISEPVVKDVVEPESPLYRIDESKEPGAREQVEWEKEGMTVEVTRTVIENGESKSEKLKSIYEPWRAVYLVGPGYPIPEGQSAPEN